MATNKKIELTAHQLWVLKYILHEVSNREDGANGIYLTPKERVSLGQIRSKLYWEIRGQRPHGANAPPHAKQFETMSKTITLTSDEIVNITSAIEDRIILLEDFISNHADSPKAHKQLKEFKGILAKLNN